MRQFISYDALTLLAAIEDYRRGNSPKVVARLRTGDPDVVEIVDARRQGNNIEVQTPDRQWHVPFACYCLPIESA